MTPPQGRETYRRLRAPSYFHPLAFPLFRGRRRATNSGLGGVAVYTDDDVDVGGRVELEIFLADGTTIVCEAEVAWIDRLPDGAPARCDVGLTFTAIDPDDRDRLSSVLSPA